MGETSENGGCPGGRAALAACAASVAAAFVLERLGSDVYMSILGVGRPVTASAAVAGLGLLGLRVLVRRSWVAAGVGGRRGWLAALLAGSLLPIPVIVVDCLGGFGPDINAPTPDAILFYPSVAVLAELVFHVAPLAMAALAAGVWTTAARGLESVGLVVAVMGEAVLQVVWGAATSPWWANGYVGLHLLVFNAVGVHLLRRHGFMCVYVYRLSYYAVWHVAWGALRLDLLF